MSPSQKPTVLVTGSSSGIGRACASKLLAAGWKVVAAVRKQVDAERLKLQGNSDLFPVILDVENRESISAAASEVQSVLSGGLDGLVNVAGIGMTRPVEYIEWHELQQMFGVNVFGQIAVTQAFLPFIRRARGRIVNISSVGAHIAIPFGGLLNSTKAAFGLISDALRLELRPFGIRVSTVEPGSIKTPAVDKTLGDVEAVIRGLPAEGQSRYGSMLREFNKRAFRRETNGSHPDVVARAVHHALTAQRPRTRYVVGKDAKLLATLPKVVPDIFLDPLRLRIFGLPTKFNAASSSEEIGSIQAQPIRSRS